MYLYFDQTYRKMYQHSQCQINIFILIIKPSFIKCIFGTVDIDIFSINLVKHLQTVDGSIKDQREYHACGVGKKIAYL